jgi:hypothetical protein
MTPPELTLKLCSTIRTRFKERSMEGHETLELTSSLRISMKGGEVC